MIRLPGGDRIQFTTLAVLPHKRSVTDRQTDEQTVLP